MNFVYVIFGLIGLTRGASLLIDGTLGIARDFGVPESIIGLTMIALGTSLREFLATVIAVLRRHGVVAVGNVLDSNRASGFRRRYSHNGCVGHAWRDGYRAAAHDIRMAGFPHERCVSVVRVSRIRRQPHRARRR